jgi:hypothetical protein
MKRITNYVPNLGTVEFNFQGDGYINWADFKPIVNFGKYTMSASSDDDRSLYIKSDDVVVSYRNLNTWVHPYYKGKQTVGYFKSSMCNDYARFLHNIAYGSVSSKDMGDLIDKINNLSSFVPNIGEIIHQEFYSGFISLASRNEKINEKIDNLMLKLVTHKGKTPVKPTVVFELTCPYCNANKQTNIIANVEECEECGAFFDVEVEE